MIAKSLESLKRNPVLIVFYVIYLAVSFFVMFSMYPKNLAANTDPMLALAAAGKMMLASLIMGALGILFFAGYGKMVADAVVDGETSTAAFGEGLKKFFVRVLLTALLLLAFYIVFAIIIAIISIPFTIMFAMSNPGNATAAGGLMGIIVSAIVMLLVIFIVPFIILWYPAIFIDDIGVFEGLKRGAKAGVKSYWSLVLMLFVIYIPTIVYMAFNFSNTSAMAKGNIFTPGYMAMCLIMSLISIIFIPFIFVAYNERKPVEKLPENEF